MLKLPTPSTRRHIQQELNLQQQRCVSLNSRRCLISNAFQTFLYKLENDEAYRARSNRVRNVIVFGFVR
jgi:hypothetical protein